MRFAPTLLVAIGLACETASASDAWTPDAKVIAKIEAAIRIPDNSSVAQYARFYAGKSAAGHHIVEGILLLPDAASAKPGVYIRASSKMPLGIMDGGCTEVNLQYDVTASRFLFTQCNGVA